MPHFKEYAKRHGGDWEQFCGKHFHAAPAWIEKIEEGVAILRQRGHSGPITKEQAVVAAELGRRGNVTSERAQDGSFLPAKAKGAIGTFGVRRGSNSAAYIRARLERDAKCDSKAAAALERLNGGIVSASKASTEMGWRPAPDPIKKAARALNSVPEEQLEQASISVSFRRAQMIVRGLARDEQNQLFDWLKELLGR